MSGQRGIVNPAVSLPCEGDVHSSNTISWISLNGIEPIGGIGFEDVYHSL
jgi:hypothetical protein